MSASLTPEQWCGLGSTHWSNPKKKTILDLLAQRDAGSLKKVHNAYSASLIPMELSQAPHSVSVEVPDTPQHASVTVQDMA